MFGDIVSFDGWNYQLTGVEKNDARVVDGLLDLCEIKPIPLTTELLEKNGFVKAECKLEWEFEDKAQQAAVVLDVDDEGLWISARQGDADRMVDYRYFEGFVSAMHELQNVFNVCHIEKEFTVYE